MNKHIEKLISKASKSLKNTYGIKDVPEEYVKQVEIQLGSLLPGELSNIINSLGGKSTPNNKIKTLCTKCFDLILKELKVKKVGNGYSVLQNSPLRYYDLETEVEEMTAKTTKKKVTTKKKAAPAAKKKAAPAAKKKEVAEKTQPQAPVAKKDPDKAVKLFTLKTRNLDALEKSKELSKQPLEILKILKALGGNKVSREKLLSQMNEEIKSNTPIEKLFAVYQKKLIEGGYMTMFWGVV